MSAWLGRFAAGLLCITGIGPAEAADFAEDSSAVSRRGLAFNPAPYSQCSVFMVTEFSAAVAGRTSQDPVDAFIFSDALGLMKNLDERSSLGGSIDAYLAEGEVKFAPTLRYKRWLTRRQSIDLLAGYMLGERDGLIGPVASVRYSPMPYAFVYTGICRDRQHWSTYDYQTGLIEVHDRNQLRVFGGLGLAGLPGLVSWGGQALAGLAVVWIATRLN